MARLLGVSFISINRWERGQQAPHALWVEAYTLLARAHGVGIESDTIVQISNKSHGRLRFFSELRQLCLDMDAKEDTEC